jgi:hypothetical protein
LHFVNSAIVATSLRYSVLCLVWPRASFSKSCLLNKKNKLCNASRTALVFANGVDDSASDTRYPDPHTELLEDAPELEKLILNAIEERIRNNNVFVASRMVKKTT